MAFNYLKVRPGQRASATWANTIVDILNMLYGGFRQSIKYSDLQHLGYDIIPDIDNLRDLGDPARAWRDIYAHYGYFLDNCYVQGRRVLKDGDPINLYDIFEPAQQKITAAVDSAKVTGYTKDIRDKVLSIRMDEYGNVGVIISDPLDVYGRVKTAAETSIVEDRVGLARESTLSTVLGRIRRQSAYIYDYAVRRNGGRLLATVDFSINPSTWPGLDEVSMGFIVVSGDYKDVSIVSYEDEGIPKPQGTDSPYVLKIVVSAGGTAYVRIPIKARFWKPFAAYFTVYNRDYEMQYNFYISLGGQYTTSKLQLPPKPLHLPANTWGRYVIHWFMEAHHGCAEVVVEIINPNSSDVTVYIGLASACELHEAVRGHGLIIGFEGDFYIPLSNETFDWYTRIFVPVDYDEVTNVTVALGVESLDGTTVTGEIYIYPGGVKVASVSTTSSDSVWRDLRVSSARRAVLGWTTFSIEFKVSTSGQARITFLQVVLRGWSKDYRYQKYVEATVSGGATSTVIDLSNDVKHVSGGYLEISAPSDGDVYVNADTPEGEIAIDKVPAGTTKVVSINGRYTYIKVQNSGTSNASVRGSIVISDSYLPR